MKRYKSLLFIGIFLILGLTLVSADCVPGCTEGRLCCQGSCERFCTTSNPCNNDDVCDSDESCDCEDCYKEQDSCASGLICGIGIYGVCLNSNADCLDLLDLYFYADGTSCDNGDLVKEADINDDGFVDITDYLLIINNLDEDGWCQDQLNDPFDPCIGCDDTDNDLVCDSNDNCPNTVLPENTLFPGWFPGYIIDVEGDSVFEQKAGRRGKYYVQDTFLSLHNTCGCSCMDILNARREPGVEFERGCSYSTLFWAMTNLC